jgi:hypothetical protein
MITGVIKLIKSSDVNHLTYRKGKLMKKRINPIVIALVFAVLLIASSYILKGNLVGDWVDSGIYVVGLYCLFQYNSNSRTKCSKPSSKSNII